MKPRPGFQQAAAAAPRPVPLSPSVDLLHCYTGLACTARPVPLVLRQMIGQQVTMERIRRAEAVSVVLSFVHCASVLAPPTGHVKGLGMRQ